MKIAWVRRWVLVISSLLPFLCAGGQFVELRAEIESLDWNHWFFCDRIGKYSGQEGTSSTFRQNQNRRCVVGANVWMIESDFPTHKVTRWFTGTNIIEHTVITQETPKAVVKRMSEQSRLAMVAPPVGHKYTRVYETADGNPGRPVRVADLMVSDIPGTVSWLAFCSGSALKKEGRTVFPPNSLWKESRIAYAGWSDATEVFKDDLGLPKSINLVLTNSQPIFQYQVRQSTNVLGWNFPLEFYGVQYLAARTSAWELHMTLRGRVTSIHPGLNPEIPADVMKVIQR